MLSVPQLTERNYFYLLHAWTQKAQECLHTCFIFGEVIQIERHCFDCGAIHGELLPVLESKAKSELQIPPVMF